MNKPGLIKTESVSDKNVKTLSEGDSCPEIGVWKHEPLAQVPFKEFTGHRDFVVSCEFSGFNDEYILSASHDKTVKLWDVEKGICLKSYNDGHTRQVSEAHLSSDGQLCVSSGWDKKVVVRDVATGDVIWAGYHEGLVTSCKFSHDGRHVLSVSDFENAVMMWDARTGELIRHLPDHHDSTIMSCTFSPNDDRIVTTSLDKSVKFFDLKSNSVTIALRHHMGAVSDACFTRDERTLCSVSWDRSLAFYDVSTGKYRSEGPDIITKAHEGCISSCIFSNDSSLLVTGGYDNYVSLWDVQNKILKLKMPGHTAWIEDVDISTDNKWIITASRDKTFRVWNMTQSHKLPMVVQRLKAIGVRMHTCVQCSKPFSVSEDDNDANDITLCVFCRLEESKSRLSNYKFIDDKVVNE